MYCKHFRNIFVIATGKNRIRRDRYIGSMNQTRENKVKQDIKVENKLWEKVEKEKEK
jgi:hypothetical protein